MSPFWWAVSHLLAFYIGMALGGLVALALVRKALDILWRQL